MTEESEEPNKTVHSLGAQLLEAAPTQAEIAMTLVKDYRYYLENVTEQTQVLQQAWMRVKASGIWVEGMADFETMLTRVGGTESKMQKLEVLEQKLRLTESNTAANEAIGFISLQTNAMVMNEILELGRYQESMMEILDEKSLDFTDQQQTALTDFYNVAGEYRMNMQSYMHELMHGFELTIANLDKGFDGNSPGGINP